jgi:3-methyladenine DNA glycosylase AlkD
MLMEELKMETQAEAAAFLQSQSFQKRKLELLACTSHSKSSKFVSTDVNNVLQPWIEQKRNWGRCRLFSKRSRIDSPL